MNSPITDLLKNVREQKKTIVSLEKNLSKYQKNKKINLDELYKSNLILESIEKELSLIKSPELVTDLTKVLEYEKSENQIKYSRFEKIFGNELNNTLKEKNMKLEGRMPNYRINHFGLDINTTKNSCKIYYGINEEIIGTEKLDPEKISDFLLKFENILENNTVDVNLFIKTYEKMVSHQKGEFKKRVPIIKLLMQLAIDGQSIKFNIDPSNSNYKSYSRVQFSHDIFKLRRDKKLKIRLITANRAQVKSKMNYLWIPTNTTTGSVYSYLELLEEY